MNTQGCVHSFHSGSGRKGIIRSRRPGELCYIFLRKMPTIRVSSSAGPYSVYCEPNVLLRTASLVARLGESTGTFYLSSPRVWKHWGKALASKMPGGSARRPILFDDREAAKNLTTIEKIARQLATAGADRGAI